MCVCVCVCACVCVRVCVSHLAGREALRLEELAKRNGMDNEEDRKTRQARCL